jgi:NAD(P)-dependent dehydrogenase (short-subunit alcohol dehydrogenase family)
MASTTPFTLPDLTGKTFVITGANSGLGLETARALARQNAHVVLACRDLDKGAEAKARILAEHANAAVEVLDLDLADLASVQDFAALIRAREGRLHGLINNAGVMAIPRQLTVDGFERQLGVNHFGHFALTGLLLDRLLATPGSRIVTVSSKAHAIGKMHWDDLDAAKSYHPWAAYGQSKLANLLFTFELARRLSELRQDVRSVACHPGYAATNLQYVGPQQYNSRIGHFVMSLGNRLIAQTAEGGAQPTLFACLSSDAQSGDYIGPSGFMGRAGAPAKLRAKHAAYDPEAMQKLWKISVERTGVDYAVLAGASTPTAQPTAH